MAKQSYRTRTQRILLYLVLIMIAVTSLIPFFWMLSTSFKEKGKVFVYPPQWIPEPFTLDSYKKIFTYIPFGRQFLNSTIVTTIVVAGQLTCCSLAAYAFARLEFPARDTIFLLYLATLMIPGYVTLIPGYILMKSLGWINTLYAIFVPGLFGSAFGTFLLRQFFLSLPKELEDAAKIDGCGYIRIFSLIMLPQIRPALATLGVFTFMGTWNDFFWPLIVINSEENRTLTVAIALLSRSYYGTDWSTLMAGATLSLVPVLITFFLAQRHFVEGVVLTGMKA